MLVLSRNPGETLTITDNLTGEQIVISAKSTFGTVKTRIAIQASERFEIARTELLDRAAELTEETETVIQPNTPPIPLVNPSWVRDLQDAKRKKR